MVSVASLKQGQKGVIKASTAPDLPIKLLELGCLPGNTVELVQVAPLNDPLYINVNGTHIAIRRAMAEQIALERIDDTPAQ